jgi:hypothetical protein
MIVEVSQPDRPHFRRQLFNVLAKVMHEQGGTLSM